MLRDSRSRRFRRSRSLYWLLLLQIWAQDPIWAVALDRPLQGEALPALQQPAAEKGSETSQLNPPRIGPRQTLARTAERFLKDHLPCRDHNLSGAYIILNIDLSLTALEASVWAAQVPEAVWLNYVLPYAW